MRTLFTLIALANLAASPPLIESSSAQDASAAHEPADGPAPSAEVAAPSEAADAPADELDLQEISRQLDNPLSRLWSLVLQENLELNEGDLVSGTETSNVAFFQPFMPIPVGRDKLWALRPVFPLVTVPNFDSTAEGGSTGHTTGFGDMQLFTVVGPDRTDGVVWGVGATFIFPTASSDVLGQGKYQAGPAGMLFKLGKKWTLGTLVQHWASYAGDADRASTKRTDIQYVARRQLPGAWSIGMGPTITIDWEAESGNRVTFPIGLGVTKTVRLGKLPIKLRFEPQYSIIKPDDYGTRWNFRFQIAPVIPNPF
jgi:hypothetical protein